MKKLARDAIGDITIIVDGVAPPPAFPWWIVAVAAVAGIGITAVAVRKKK